VRQNQKLETRNQKAPLRRHFWHSAAFWFLVSGFWFWAACNRTNIDRAEWLAMSLNEKTFYVRTLLGHEKAKEAKGGNDRVFTRAADDYVKRIDDAYARGDRRNVDTIFEEMGRIKTRNQKLETRMRRSAAVSGFWFLVSGFATGSPR
jgi:hypothetical protein